MRSNERKLDMINQLPGPLWPSFTAVRLPRWHFLCEDQVRFSNCGRKTDEQCTTFRAVFYEWETYCNDLKHV